MEPQHIRAKPGDVARRTVISGDPARVTQLSGLLKHRRLVNENRGFLAYTGEYNGEELTVTCHGIGGPSVAIVVEELAMLGARAMVRLGTCGGLLKEMKVGETVIATRAGYQGGTLDQYFGKKIMPRPDAALTGLLDDSVKSRGISYYKGPVFSSDGFYAEDTNHIKAYSKAGYIAVEMECATLFGLGKLRNVKTASVLLVSDNIIDDTPIVDARALGRYATRSGELVFETLSRLEV